MKSAWTRRGIVVGGVVALVWMSGGLSERWFTHSLAAPESEQPKVLATTVAVMDVAFIFKKHNAFNQQITALQQKAQGVQQQMAATQAQLQLLKARAEQATDKAEKGKLEEELAKQSTEFQLSTRKLQQEVGDAEAKIYFDTYLLLQEETKKYCRSRGIHVALKTIRDPIKVDDRNSVMQGLNRPIVFSDAPDITDDILKALDAAVEAKGAQGKVEEAKPR